MDNLKPGFYYVSSPLWDGGWSVGQLYDLFGKLTWDILGDADTDDLIVGAYLDPQPGEQSSTTTGRTISTGCGGLNVEASRWTPGDNGEHIYEELIDGKWVRKARLIR